MHKRNNLIKAIHVGRRALGFSDDVYRAYILGITGKDSLRSMNDAQLLMIVKRMRKDGFINVRDKQVNLVFYIWGTLFNAGIVQKNNMAALDAYSKRICKKTLGSCKERELSKIIETLKEWALRTGVDLNLSPYKARGKC